MPVRPAPDDVIVATHFWSPGWATALEAYLRERGTRVRWIGHPLFADGQPGTYRLVEHGVVKEEFNTADRPGKLRLIKHLFRTVRWAARGGRTDLFIAGDNLIAMAGLWLRWRGRTDALVLYSIDFVPRRFANPLLNWVYHRVDRFAVAASDVTWNGSDGIAAGRRQRDGGVAKTPQITVPMGADVRGIAGRGHQRRSGQLVYLGHLLEKQGLQVVIEALPAVLTQHPHARLLVVGDGPYRAALDELAGRLGVASAIEFAGFMDDHHRIEDRLLESVLGVAPYVPDPANYTQFTDLPGKIINYLACGLPVVTTAVPRNAAILENEGAGQVIEYSPAAAAAAILGYLDDVSGLRDASTAATRLAGRFGWDAIFDRAFSETARLRGLAPD